MAYKTVECPSVRPSVRLSVQCQHIKTLRLRDRWADVDKSWHVQCSEKNINSTQLNSTQPEITDAGVWHLYVRIIINKTIL